MLDQLTVTLQCAPVAQRIEHPPPKRGAAGSIPAGRATLNPHFTSGLRSAASGCCTDGGRSDRAPCATSCNDCVLPVPNRRMESRRPWNVELKEKCHRVPTVTSARLRGRWRLVKRLKECVGEVLSSGSQTRFRSRSARCWIRCRSSLQGPNRLARTAFGSVGAITLTMIVATSTGAMPCRFITC
jgi:hypothetical protein